MEFKGTKGKWHSVEYAGNYILQSGDKYGDDNILDEENVNEEAKYNALLISKAPELLDMLIDIKAYLGSDKREEVEHLIKASVNLKNKTK